MGLSFGAGPCLASCGPILVSYLAGSKRNIPKGIVDYVLFSAARVLVYLVLGLGVFFLGRFVIGNLLSGLSRYVLIIGGIFIILIGVFTAFDGVIKFQPCQSLYQRIFSSDTKNIFIIGLVVGLLPCAPLLAILSYVGITSRSVFEAILYSLFFGLGTALSPLILLVVITGLIPNWMAKQGAKPQRIFALISGLVIVFLGVRLLRSGF